MYRIEWSKSAVKQLRRIQPAKQRQAIYSAVDELQGCSQAEIAAHNKVRQLKNHQYGWRLRVGDYRVLFDLHQPLRIARIEQVRKRDDHTY